MSVNICQSEQAFRGIFFRSDLRQTLPVVRGGSNQASFEAMIAKSPL
jgi:hypothetical protein